MTRALGKEYDFILWEEGGKNNEWKIANRDLLNFRSKSAVNLTQICSFYNSDKMNLTDPATERIQKF